MSTVLGTNVVRKDACEKVTGQAQYTADKLSPGTLFAAIVKSTVAHGAIRCVDTSKAENAKGVAAVITGDQHPLLCGVLLRDRPTLATDRVRYFGEPVALVVAGCEADARAAAALVEVTYDPLPVVGTVQDALTNQTLLHTTPYAKLVEDVYPQDGTNIASAYAVRKGDMAQGWAACDYIVEQHFSLPATAHAAMETHCAEAEIKADGRVEITASTQSPYTVKELVSSFFDFEEGKVRVHAPLLGGGFGGKSNVQLEILAVLASQAVGGKKVRILNSRYEEFTTSPSRLAMEADVKIGVDKLGKIQAADLKYYLDCGAYTDIAPYMSKAIAVDCTGPYNIENLSCDSCCVYTNHNYATAFRGFGHESYTFCIERVLEQLSEQCGLDVRALNAIKPGDLSPTQVEITASNAGNLSVCIQKLETMLDCKARMDLGNGKVRASGMSCLWKTPNPPTDAVAGAVITFNSDGSLNLITGVVEMGSGGQTMLAQLLAEKMRMRVDRIHVVLDTDTATAPKYYKTVASMTTYLAGRAVMQAADDALNQIKQHAAVVLRAQAEDLDYGDERVYLKHLPKYSVGFQDLVQGVKYPDGNAVGGQVIGRGSAIFHHLSPLAQDTGKGNVGASWTVGAQAVEVEYDTTDHTYRILKAATVMDVGPVVDPKATRGVIQGGMSMGLSLASREHLVYDAECINQSTSFRTYNVLHIGEEPQYLIEFVETPQLDAPYGTRAFTEHGIIGMPAALANALSRAAGVPLNQLPLTPESIWRACHA